MVASTAAAMARRRRRCPHRPRRLRRSQGEERARRHCQCHYCRSTRGMGAAQRRHPSFDADDDVDIDGDDEGGTGAAAGAGGGGADEGSGRRRRVAAAFVGGQSVIGSSRGGDDHDHDDGDYHAVRAGNYPWLLLLSATTGCVWRFVIDGPNVALLSGYAGRMGFATFVGMNAVMVTAYGPAGVVDWDRYYGGFVAVEPDDAGGIRHVGEAEDAPSSHTPPSSSHASSSTSSRWRASWDWAEDEEAGYQAASYVLGAVWLGVVAGGTRVLHERRRLSRIDGDGDAASSSSPSSSHPPPPKPPPLDNVVVPAVFALSSMLAAYCVPRYESRARSALFNGLAVGSYVAMASLQRIPTVSRFASVSLLASVWGLALTPFFVGFAGSE